MEKYWQKEIETASRDEIVALQSERLRKQIKHVYDNVKIYRDRMDEMGVSPDDIKTVEDISKLPFSYKQDLRDTYPYGMFAVPMKDVVRLHASSGTTGKQIVVGYTERDLDIWAEVCARQLYAAGGGSDDIVHIAYGYGLFTGGLGLHGGAQKIGATVVPVSSGNTTRQITILKDFGCTILACTPSYALFLAETMKEMGIDKSELKLKAGIFGAEPWTDEMRQQLEDLLGIKAFDIYGLTEVMGPGVAYGCSVQDGMHVNEDHFIVEIIDPDTGKPLPDGEQGEIVFTALTKEAFPIMRYRTRDIGVIIPGKCACGRTFRKISKPKGRTDDMLIIRGVNVFPSQIETVLLRDNYSANYQIVVDRVNNLDTLEVKVEMNEQNFTDSLSELSKKERALQEDLKSLLGLSAKVTLVQPRSLERSTGKAVRVIDKRKLHD